ncbi:SDR family NAD(P)-dependent oxidoreductase [Paludibacterium yongneupense]|uniref:SDR family NAD(P)-dependent oxidoreductase n=1 Tax=Paludibacterium yongneupense TaxID=400061 RepID=UPI00040DBF26|nr:SDR family NAD(P)-dependent oxidoreductase [Paludibacterium yongneupense]
MSGSPSHKFCLVTGGSFGIGRETAQALAQHGHTVYIVARDARRTADAVESIRKHSGNADVHGALADLSSLASILDLSRRMRRQLRKLDILVNSAGSLFAEHQLSADGFDKSWALNHLAYVALTLELLPLLQAASSARIVNMASDLHLRGRIDFDALRQVPAPRAAFSAVDSYAQSKLANVLFTYALARRLQGSGVTVNCLHPGDAAGRSRRTTRGMMKLVNRVLQPFRQPAALVAQAPVHLALSPELEGVNGMYFVGLQPGVSSLASRDVELQERLWTLSLEQVARASLAGSLL